MAAILALILAAGADSSGVNISQGTLITVALCLVIVVLVIWLAFYLVGRFRP